MKAAAILVGDDGIEPPQVESESTALPLCKSPMTFAWSNKCSQQLFIIAAECAFVNRFFKFLLRQYRIILSADAASEKCKLLNKKRRSYFVYYRAFLQRGLCFAAAAAVLKPSGGNGAGVP